MSALPVSVQRPSLCIFCHERKANTREHPWPKWLLECLRGQGPGRTTAWLGKERTPQSFGGELRIKCVCRPCNEGWLSDLENRAKQLLIPLLRDFKWPLSAEDQAVISTWTMKTAMVFEYTNPDRTWFFSEAERMDLRSSRRPPQHSFVWLGRLAQSNVSQAEGRRLYAQDSAILRTSYVTTFAFGRLVAQLVTVRLTEQGTKLLGQARFVLDTKPGPWATHLLQIWPTARATVTWPPDRSFTENGLDLDELASRFTLGIGTQ